MAALPDGIDAAWLKARWLWAVPLVDQNGTAMSDAFLEDLLKSAFKWVGDELGIEVLPVTVTGERHDIDRSSPATFYQHMLDKRPVRSLTKLALKWGNRPDTATIPNSWLHLRNANYGEIEIIVDDTAMDFSLATGWPFLMGPGSLAYNRMPSWFEWSYEAGIPDGEIPELMLNVAGMVAASIPLAMAGDVLLGPPGVKSKSISMDGLSQSMSAPSGFRDRIELYRADIARDMAALRAEYTGIPMRPT